MLGATSFFKGFHSNKDQGTSIIKIPSEKKKMSRFGRNSQLANNSSKRNIEKQYALPCISLAFHRGFSHLKLSWLRYSQAQPLPLKQTSAKKQITMEDQGSCWLHDHICQRKKSEIVSGLSTI